MTLAATLPALEATHHGLGLNWSTRLEESVRAGRNSYFIAAFQLHQASKGLAFADKALEAAGAQPTILACRVVVYLTPILLGILTKIGIDNDTLRSIVLFMQNHFGNLCHVVAAVSSIAMIYFGHILFGVTALSLLGIGLLDRYGLLPLQMRKIIHVSSPVILIATSVFFGNILDRVVAAVSVALYAYNFYSYYFPKYANYQAPKHCLGYDRLKNVVENQTVFRDLKINREYVHEQIPLQGRDCDIGECIKAFDAINWDKHARPLRKKIENDQKFRETLGNPDEKSDAELIAFAKTSLEGFINSVKNKRILEGEPLDYERLHTYLKFITAHLTVHLIKERDEITKTDILFRLAIEGGSYCGPGKYEVAESIYASLLEEMKEIPFRVKVLNTLQDCRNRIMELFYSTAFSVQPETFNKIVDVQDIHLYNSISNLFGEGLGLRKAGADNDSLAIVPPFVRLILDHTIGSKFKDEFWRIHSVPSIVAALANAIGKSRLPKGEFYKWWNNWIERQEIDKAKKEALMDELAMKASLFDSPLENSYGVDLLFIQAMLIDMGVLTAAS